MEDEQLGGSLAPAGAQDAAPSERTLPHGTEDDDGAGELAKFLMESERTLSATQPSTHLATAGQPQGVPNPSQGVPGTSQGVPAPPLLQAQDLPAPVQAAAAGTAQPQPATAAAVQPVWPAPIPQSNDDFGGLEEDISDIDDVVADYEAAVKAHDTEMQDADIPDDSYVDEPHPAAGHTSVTHGNVPVRAGTQTVSMPSHARPATQLPNAKRARVTTTGPLTTAQITALFDDDDEDDLEREEVQHLGVLDVELAAQAAAIAAASASAAAEVANPPPRYMVSEVDGEAMHVTSHNGTRVYCQLRRTVAAHESLQLEAPPTRFSLLSKPIAEMLREVEEKRLQQAVAASHAEQLSADAALAEELQAAETGGAGTSAGTRTSPGAAAMQTPGATPARARAQFQRTPARGARGVGRARGDGDSGTAGGGALWVNKHAPKTFMSLLSDEAINREVVKWVKSWDSCVFGKEVQVQAGFAPRPVAGKGGDAGGGMSKMAADLMRSKQRRVEGDTRPEHKAILICGPPGLGKTTLAHIVAKHCGYHPYEINASDDRTAATLTSRVADAVQMQAVMGDRKPNCVIIDEIDGATGGTEGHSAIAALLRLINAGSKAPRATGADTGEGDEEGASNPGQQTKAGSKGKKGPPPLSRPLICIANDLYAPALRPLRDVARVFHFKAPDTERLVSRLSEICTKEGVAADPGALHSLAARTDCDIRAALNTLQLLARQQQVVAGGAAAAHGTPLLRRGGVQQPAIRITQKQVEELNIGMKDASKTAFAVWDALLHAPSPHKRAPTGPGGAPLPPAKAAVAHLKAMYELVQDFGDHELVLAGIHENLHTVRFLDINMRKSSALMDAMADAELLITCARRHSEFQLLTYVPAMVLKVHLTAAQVEKPQLQWPRAVGEAWRRSAANRELMHAWASTKVAARVLQAYDTHSLALEVLPALTRVLSPQIRALAPHLLTHVEQSSMAHTVGVMADYGVRFSLEEEQGAGGPGIKPHWLKQGQQQQPGAPPPRPVPLVPALDLVHAYGGRPSVAGPVRFVPLVLRQLLNQQVNVEQIRRAELAKGICDASEPASSLPPTAAAGPEQQQKQLPPTNHAAANSRAAALRKQPSAAPLKPQAPTTAKPSNWLEAMRVAQCSKHKVQAQAVRAAGSEGAPEGEGAPNGPLKFAVLYRFNEGYTNAVKRPLIMRELL